MARLRPSDAVYRRILARTTPDPFGLEGTWILLHSGRSAVSTAVANDGSLHAVPESFGFGHCDDGVAVMVSRRLLGRVLRALAASSGATLRSIHLSEREALEALCDDADVSAMAFMRSAC